MLIETQYKVGDVVSIKLSSGEEMIARLDAENDELILKVDQDEIDLRKKNWKNPTNPPKKGVLAKYAASVKSASLGAITD